VLAGLTEHLESIWTGIGVLRLDGGYEAGQLRAEAADEGKFAAQARGLFAKCSDPFAGAATVAAVGIQRGLALMAPALGYRLACDDDVTAEASQCVQEGEKVLINSICTLLLEPMTCAGKNLHITQAGHQRW
jgi:hypothetical protein